MRLRSALVVALFSFASAWLAASSAWVATAHAQQRTITVEMTPTARVQIAMWIESQDGSLFQTLRLTDAVAYRGIGNRPGAEQMNSGYRFPYGRREGVLPIWAHRRFEHQGGAWRRVIFIDRDEGYASRQGDDHFNTLDHFFCLSFRGGESLDAVSCASPFNSNKGRFMTEADVAAGYSEPFEDSPGHGRERVLTIDSLYPPRGDAQPVLCPDCPTNHEDSDDLLEFPAERLRVMPDLDIVTMATPPRDMPFSYTFDVPDSWPDGHYTIFVEANTEFDFADPSWRLAAPVMYPEGLPGSPWDCYAIGTCGYGTPWRGQPSVLYAVDVVVGPGGSTDGVYTTSDPIGHGDLHGLTGDVLGMDGSGMVDDPFAHPGSGADRLRAAEDGVRIRASVPVIDPCASSMPPPECGRECTETHPCGEPLICGPDFTCVGRCTIEMHPPAPGAFEVTPVTDTHHSHEWAHLSFTVPDVMRGIQSYEIRVGPSPIVDEASFMAARPANAAALEDQAVTVPIDGAAGSTVEVEIGHLLPSSHYYVGIRLYDGCHAPGAIVAGEVTTTVIHFTTVSPCFVATAAYGSPLDARIGVLRRFRDRWLMSNAVGRELVRAYYEIGPTAAAWIGESEDRRAAARAVLDPIVTLLE